ncbi:MAG: hypothetical protein IKO83_08565 [Oscillospiraceae bacterium]|nr:hypothetical protein [Oscillospiraceae bacterium]
MKKKVFSFLLILAMLLSAAVCGVTAQADEPAAVLADSYDVDAQLSMIFFQLEKLMQTDGENTWYYTVTDLDHDGNLEFVAASQHPQDRSTNLKLWEVSADRTALTECSLNKDADESFPDMMTDCADTYHDTQTDTWFYLCYDNIVISNSEVYTIKSAVSLKDGVIGYDAFAVQHTLVENNMFAVSYTDLNGMTISQEQYNAAGVNAFAGTERSSTSFEWLTGTDVKSLARLIDSYSVFAGVKAPTEVFPVPKPAALQAMEPSATPAPVPTAAPSGSTSPSYLMITKNPTNESRKTGDTALFVACANAYDSLTWTLVAPNGGEFSVQQFRSVFPKAGVSGEYSTTLSIGNIERDMNKWGAYCTFYYKGQSARTSTAYISVKQEKPTPTAPIGETGDYVGTVIATSFSTVTVDCPGVDLFEIPLSICTITDTLDIGADATVYWVKVAGSRGVTVTSCTIRGTKPAPQPVYGSMSGTAYHDTAFTVYVVLQNGSGLHLNGNLVNIIGGNDIDGASCIVYYTDYPSEATIYKVDIYGKDPTPAPQPEPEPTPQPEPEPTPQPEPEPAPQPEPEPAPQPEPEPAPEPSYGVITGRAFRSISDSNKLELFLDNGDSVIVDSYSHDGYTCTLNAEVGAAGGGNPCEVFYVDYPSAANIYKVVVSAAD